MNVILDEYMARVCTDPVNCTLCRADAGDMINKLEQVSVDLSMNVS